MAQKKKVQEPPQPIIDDGPVSLSELATEALEDNNGDTVEAAAYMTAALMRDEALRARIIDEAIRIAVRSRIESRMRSARAPIINAGRQAAMDRISSDRQTRALSKRTALAIQNSEIKFFEYPLARGLHLGQATRDEIVAQAAIHAGSLHANLRLKIWFEAIAQGLPAGRRVRDVFAESRLGELFKSAERSAETILRKAS